jgi:hypothetical protein
MFLAQILQEIVGPQFIPPVRGPGQTRCQKQQSHVNKRMLNENLPPAPNTVQFLRQSYGEIYVARPKFIKWAKSALSKKK